jgi:membrane protein required for colicin V production
MNWLDIIIFIILVFGLIRGLFRGFVLEFSSLIGIIISIYIAKYYSGPFIRLAESLFKPEQDISPVIGFILTFLIALLVLHFVALLIDKFVNLTALGWLNKMLGGLVGFIKYLLIISLFINAFGWANDHLQIVEDENNFHSKFYMHIKKIVPGILPFLHTEDTPEIESEKNEYNRSNC